MVTAVHVLTIVSNALLTLDAKIVLIITTLIIIAALMHAQLAHMHSMEHVFPVLISVFPAL